MTEKYDILLIGSGLHNAVFARLALDKGYRCLCVEKRNHIGGNIYDKYVDDINVHVYGAHIFHTSDDEVWNFVNKYTSFNNYINSPIANYNGEIYNLPFNMNTFHQMWNDVITPDDAKKKIDSQRLKTSTPSNLEEQALSMVGEDIYQKLIKGYTEKQWGKSCKDLPPEIIKRLPLRFVYNNNYFNDKYQGVPEHGYSNLIKKLFDGCDIIINCDYFKEKDKLDSMSKTKVYTGRIDEFFDYCYGYLEFRSLKFESIKLDVSNYQGNAVVNYTDEKRPYTRIIEHKHFDVSNKQVNDLPYTWITKEYPVKFDGFTEPYYPINDKVNNSLYNVYHLLSLTVPNVIFAGRLGTYAYYDMDKVIRQAINNFQMFEKGKGVI